MLTIFVVVHKTLPFIDDFDKLGIIQGGEMIGKTLTAEEQQIIEEFKRKMKEEVIPQIVETVHQRQITAAATRNIILRT